MLRIGTSQPATEATMMVTPGSTACLTALDRNVVENVTCSAELYPPVIGNQCSSPAKTNSVISPNQKYGTDDRNVVAGSRWSHQDPRRQPASIPSRVPMTKLRIVVQPTSTSVHGSVDEITEETDAGKYVN